MRRGEERRGLRRYYSLCFSTCYSTCLSRLCGAPPPRFRGVAPTTPAGVAESLAQCQHLRTRELILEVVVHDEGLVAALQQALPHKDLHELEGLHRRRERRDELFFFSGNAPPRSPAIPVGQPV